MSQKPPLRRKRLLINPQFQAFFAVYAVVTTLLMAPFFIAANFYFFNLFNAKVQALGLPPGHELLQFADRQQALLVVVFIGAIILALVVNVILSYVFSNRIAGSMYRLTTQMNQTLDFEHAHKIEPRKADFFLEVYEAYNRLLERSQT